MHALHEIIVWVWDNEAAPEEWHQCIIPVIPIYKGKGSRSDCCNHRGIALLSVPVHIILARIGPTFLSHRQTPSTEWFYARSLHM